MICSSSNFDYDRSQKLQFVVDKEWIELIHSRFIMGIDGIVAAR